MSKIEYVNKGKLKLGNNVVEEYLKSLGIEQVDSFLHQPAETDLVSPTLLPNIEAGIAIAKDMVLNKRNTFLMVDSDTDGITSAAIFHNYFKSICPDLPLEWGMHEEKEHGIRMELVGPHIEVVVIPDAGSNQAAELQELSDRGVKVLVLDHHKVSTELSIPNVVIINNQLDNFPNPHLSGAGVVYKFVEYYDKMVMDGTRYLLYCDLAALGILADGMDVRNLDNNAIIHDGLRNIHNPMLKEFMATTYATANRLDYVPYPSLSYHDLNAIRNKRHIIWRITPLINAMIRVGSMEEKHRLFRAFTEVNSLEFFTSTTPRGRERTETIYQLSVRECGNAHSRQATRVEKGLQQISAYIDEHNLATNKVIVVKLDAVNLLQTLTGLVATKLVNIYGKPVLLLRPGVVDGERVYRGSGRANKHKGFSSFRNTLLTIEEVEYAEGHDMALGVGVKEENLTAFTDAINEELADILFSPVEEVAGEVIDETFNLVALTKLADAANIFNGGGMPEPKFHFKLTAPLHDCKIQGAKGDSVKVMVGRVSFVTFKNEKVANKLLSLSTTHVEMEAVGSVSYNEWMGRKNLQILTNTMDLTGVNRPNGRLF